MPASQIVICPRDAADIVGTCGSRNGIHMVGGRVQKDYGTIEEVESGRIIVRIVAFKPYAREGK